MPTESETRPPELCSKCGQAMEQVHFIAGPSDLIVYKGPPPDGLLGSIKEVFTGELVRDESGMPLLAGYKEGFRFPGLHCKRCRQLVIPYGT